MVLSKFVIYNFAFLIFYKLINKYKLNKYKLNKHKLESNLNTTDNENIGKKKVSNLNFKDIIDNFHIKKKINFDEVDPNILKLMNIKNKIEENEQISNKFIVKNNIILSDNKNRLILKENNKYIKYSFNAKKEFYKIKFNLKSSNITYLNLVISNNKKNYIFNSNEYNLLKDNINKFNFTLDNNFFDNEKIDIYILLYNNENNIIIENLIMEIIEVDKKEENTPILIISINNKNIPIYFTTNNLLYG